MIKILIIEDDPHICVTVKDYLLSQSDMKICGTYPSIELFRSEHSKSDDFPDIVLLDIVLPGISGIEGIHHIKERFPKTSIIMFSVMDDGFSIFRSLCEGAIGYLTKDFTLDTLKTAIVDVFEGKGSMSPTIARKVAEYFHPKKKLSERLTTREVDIVNGILEGLSYKLIAVKLEISIDTVRKHIKNVYRKLEINSKAELMSQYFNN